MYTKEDIFNLKAYKKYVYGGKLVLHAIICHLNEDTYGFATCRGKEREYRLDPNMPFFDTRAGCEEWIVKNGWRQYYPAGAGKEDGNGRENKI